MDNFVCLWKSMRKEEENIHPLRDGNTYAYFHVLFYDILNIYLLFFVLYDKLYKTILFSLQFLFYLFTLCGVLRFIILFLLLLRRYIFWYITLSSSSRTTVQNKETGQIYAMASSFTINNSWGGVQHFCLYLLMIICMYVCRTARNGRDY